MSAAAWSPDGTRVLSAHFDSTPTIRDAATGETIRYLTAHTAAVFGVTWSPTGDSLVTCSNDGTACIWDAATGELCRRLTGHIDWVRGGAWSPDADRVVTGSYDGTVRVWDVATGMLVGTVLIGFDGGQSAVFDAVTEELVGASEGAWRWLGWTVVRDGKMDRLPAETYGALPPLPQP